MFYYIFQLVSSGQYIVVCKEYILLFRLFIYVLYSFTHTFSTFHIGLLFTYTVARANLSFSIAGIKVASNQKSEI